MMMYNSGVYIELIPALYRRDSNMIIDSKLLDLKNMHQWEVYSRSLETELRQCTDEGRDVSKYADVVKAVSAMPLDATREDLADVLFKALTSAPIREDFPYNEPDDIDAIRAARPADHAARKDAPAKDELRSRIKGAWLGRICGCLLGKPVECWRTPEIIEIAKSQNNWPLHTYLRYDEDMIRKLGRESYLGAAWIDKLDGAAPSDDDTNYTSMAALCIVGRHGRDFTPADVAKEWIASQPKDAYCTAERRAFCNFMRGIMPPESATYKNPDREYIGAQIRADYFGYINPGDTETAADMAWRDASISHVKNGIYGEMFIAAMLARAAVSDDVEDVIRAGLNEIPAASRLAEAINEALDWHAQGLSADECFERIHKKYNEFDGYDWVHTISNAEIVTLCLLFAGDDCAKAICLAVDQGFDTDCNGATVGSIIGMMKGENVLSEEWTKPLCGKLRTGIFGHDVVSIEDMVDLTMKHMA